MKKKREKTIMKTCDDSVIEDLDTTSMGLACHRVSSSFGVVTWRSLTACLNQREHPHLVSLEPV